MPYWPLAGLRQDQPMKLVACKPKLGRWLGLDTPFALGTPVEPGPLAVKRLPGRHGTERLWPHLPMLGPVAKPGPWWPRQPERPGRLERPVQIQRKLRPAQLGQPGKSGQLGLVWPLRRPGLVGQLEQPGLLESLALAGRPEMQHRPGRSGPLLLGWRLAVR